jgi:integrase
MASLQARHQLGCAIVIERAKKNDGKVNRWTTFAAATKAKGCTCKPEYQLTRWHDDAGKKKLIRESVGHDRKAAERDLKALEGDEARGNVRLVEDISFEKWADEWLGSATVKESSRQVYGYTLDYGKRAFGRTKVRNLTPADVRRFLDLIRTSNVQRRRPVEEGETVPEVSAATLAKHLRQLGACLQAAIPEYAVTNPVRLLHKTLRPKVAKSLPAYYTDEELARLWPELAYRPVMLALCKTALTTGLRFGELAALTWDDVTLQDRELHVSRTIVDRIGIQTPKSGDQRTVDLTPQAAAVLEAWSAVSGGEKGGLVFEREEGGHLTPAHVLRQVLYPALERAGIPRVGERGRKRDFHSFRHSFARIALEGGQPIDWVQRQLGHSSITLTVDTYGSWSRTAQKAQAAKLKDAFPV